MKYADKSNLAGFYYYSLVYKFSNVNDLTTESAFLDLCGCQLQTIASGEAQLGYILNQLFFGSRNMSKRAVGDMLITAIRSRILDNTTSPSRAMSILLKMHRERLLPSSDRIKLIALNDDFAAVAEQGVSLNYAVHQLLDYLTEHEYKYANCTRHYSGYESKLLSSKPVLLAV